MGTSLEQIDAAEDMDQATAASVALRTDPSTDEAWRRALETAMAAAYMRPFTTGAWKTTWEIRTERQGCQ